MKSFYQLWYYSNRKFLYSYQYRFKKHSNLLKDKLISENKTRWLDLGSWSRFNEGFLFADILDENTLPEEMKGKYFYWDATKELDQAQRDKMGTFDFIRMQHVFEHFTVEDGKTVLQNAMQLLNKDGYLLLTVPDLAKFVKRYNRSMLDYDWTFAEFAEGRIGENAPQSWYFSAFTHHYPYQPHLWCYDQEGMLHQIKRSISAQNITFLTPYHKLANIPFTHNRPLEDLCVLIQK